MNFFAAHGTGIRQPPLETWPAAITLAWRNATRSRRGRLRSPATYKSYADSVAAYLLMYPLIWPIGRRWNERIAGGSGVPEKNRARGNPAMILLFHATASRGTAL
jgi:hypothetical protein